MKLRQKKKIALVLSGGGIKAAAFHIGVCLALKELGFQMAGGQKEIVRQKFPENLPLAIRMYVGSSAGAFIASVLAAGYPIESLINAFQVGSGSEPVFTEEDGQYLKSMTYRDIFSINGLNVLKLLPDTFFKKSLVVGGMETLLKNGFKLNGLFTTKGLEKYLRQEVFIENDFARLGVELFVIATQLNHTRKAIFGNFPESRKNNTTKYVNYATISDAVAASASLPPVFAPYGITRPDGKEIFYFDGEIRDTLSTHVAADHGADLIIGSYSVQPYHFTPEMGSLHKYGIPVIINQALYQVIQQKIAKHIEYQSNIKKIYNDVDSFFKEHKLPAELREQLLEKVCIQGNYKPGVDYIYIHPRPQNYEMFFVDHFSLNPQILARIVRIGFKAAYTSLRRHEF
jgi:predicted acylesterase/phospholipase RssA